MTPSCPVEAITLTSASSPMPSSPASPVRWVAPSDVVERDELGRWCSAVGGPIVRAARGGAAAPGTSAETSAAPSSAPTLTLVAWNTHVGHGDLDLLLRRLRAGELTGGVPVGDFVLLLQEAYRVHAAEGAGPLPPWNGSDARAADWIGPEHPVALRADGQIAAVAERQDLHLVYVPSMRNGREAGAGGHGPPEDRGNAILSTLPLSDLRAIELPVQKQRRVAVTGRIEGVTGGGDPWSLQVASVHLDHIADWRSFHRSFGQNRLDHAELLVDLLADEAFAVVGGDFNTWFRGDAEPAVRLMRRHFPDPVAPPDDATLGNPYFPLDRLVDYLFFRVPEGWTAEYRVVPDRHGSDHYPLVGTLRWVGGSGAAMARGD